MRVQSTPPGARPRGLFQAPVEPPTVPRLWVEPAWSPARLTWAIIHSVWPYALGGALLRALFNISSVLLPVAVGGLVDAVILPATQGTPVTELTTPLASWVGLLAGLYLLVHVGYRFGGRLGWYGVQRAQYELSQRVLGRVLDQRGFQGTSHPPGRLLSLTTADARRACQSVYVAVYPPGELLGLLVAAGVLFWVHPLLGIGVLIALPLVLGLMHVIALPLRRRSRTEQSGLADAAASAADLVAGYRVIRGLHAQHTAAARYRNISRSALTSTIVARSAMARFQGASTAIGQLFAAAVSIGAALLAFNGQISVGQLVTVTAVAVTLLGPLQALIGTLGSMWAMTQASAERLLELLRAPHNPAALGTTAPLNTSDDDANSGGTLEFSQLGLTETAVFDARITPGEFTVLELSSAERTTLCNILALRAQPSSGTVHYAATPLSDHAPGWLRARMLVAPHTPGMLAGTVLSNVQATGGEPIPQAAAQDALAVAALTPDELPNGYATVVADSGWQLSGGQRQRIALARALAADPGILVLEEPTSSVDAVTEHRIATRLRAHRKGRTTIVLTSSSAFCAVADRILTVQAVNVHA